ncbi:class I SAM-dependent methyltransferase [Legionella nagasakiensis]|uniref:class I SAM-dependent methyltransferase n=1 Tax=Legionella nagasakiensis TaxID=535290 RepID=UPI00105474CA|nr:SAM-dependent methyltransferase [Legionella nagasakiensis]
MNLIELIYKQLSIKGDMPFVEFMHQALYAPQFGYYSSGLQKFGSKGDFITAPELTSLFGKTLANQCQQVLCALNYPVVFEFGAGSGKLCVDVLMRLEQLGCLPEEYHILEVSSNLRHRQEALVKQCIPHLANKVRWWSCWPQEPVEGVMIANEVLDAMPVHRFTQTKEGLLESYITVNQQGELTEVFKPCSDRRLIQHVNSILSPDLCPYQSEANLFIDDWLQQCFNMLIRGAFFIIDYGFPRHEYYHPERCTGTLMCHYYHQSHPNPLAHPGEEDITAHVDFTHVAEAAYNAGFHVGGFTNQASFLLANDLLNLLAAIEREGERIQEQQAVKQLVQANEMGELFKVLALTKDFEASLRGFQLHDKRASL